MKKLVAVAAIAMTMFVVNTAPPATAVGCPRTCVLSGIVEGSQIVPDPNKLDITLKWTAIDLRGDTPNVRAATVRVVATFDTEYSAVGPRVSRGVGQAHIDYTADYPYDTEDVFEVDVVRTGDPLTGAITIDSATLDNEYIGSYALSVNLNYLRFSGGTQQFKGIAFELDYKY